MADLDLIAELHAGLDRRPRPEEVAAVVARVLDGRLSPTESGVLAHATAHADRPWWFTMMSQDWERPVDATATLAYVGHAFGEFAVLAAGVDPADPDAVAAECERLGRLLRWSPGGQRLNRDELRAAGIELSARRYRRACHALDVLWEKVSAMRRMALRRRCAQSARVGLATSITIEEMAADVDAACFVAYFVARRNVRRGFSLDGKDNPFDEVAEMLFRRLGDDSDWWQVARANPRPEILARLSPERQGEMVGSWWATMRTAAALCGLIHESSPVDRSTMIVRRGQDSDTWNLAAGAYNTARAAWVAALTATKSLDLLNAVCPPKLPRLMAGDLTYWLVSTGSQPTHPDVRVAARLAPAWEVVEGDARCLAADVRAACEAEAIDAEKTGWLAPLAPGRVARFEPTPELVHGIAVGDPLLAAVLRRAGWWSGKPKVPAG